MPAALVRLWDSTVGRMAHTNLADRPAKRAISLVTYCAPTAQRAGPLVGRMAITRHAGLRLRRVFKVVTTVIATPPRPAPKDVGWMVLTQTVGPQAIFAVTIAA